MKSFRSPVLFAASLLALSSGATHARANPAVPWLWPAGASAPSAAIASCVKPQGLPPVRSAGSLVVESPPRAKPERWLRLRTHQSPPGINGTSHWEGPEVPLFVPLVLGPMELELLDPIAGGYMALYRSSPSTLGPNGSYEVRLFSCAGHTLVSLPLNPLLSRRDQLEVQDIRYADGTLYFNEACQTYSRDAGGRCSALVAVDPLARRVLWRTPSLTSNSVIKVVGQHVVAGYGFTAERDWLKIVRRSDGRIVEQESLPSNHFGLEVRGTVLDVEIGGKWLSFQMSGFATANPSLTPSGARAASTANPSASSAPVAVPPLPSFTAPWPAPSWPLPLPLPQWQPPAAFMQWIQPR